jgi:hypothetical protein
VAVNAREAADSGRDADGFTGDDESPVPGVRFDTSVPNVARIYDYILGGKDNYAADRKAAEELLRVLPDVEVACRENRDFLRRAVRFVAGQGVRQFIDIGSGLPTAENTHQVAQAVSPESKVVYVDYDPVVVTHARALLEPRPNVAVLDASLQRPGMIVGSETTRNLIDFTKPVAILLVAVLHFIRDDEDPYGIAGILKSVMSPGSYLVISHVTADSVSREETEAGMAVYDKASAPVVPRRYDEVLKLFDGTELAAPGLVSISDWRSRRRRAGGPMRSLIYGGVGCKPAPPEQPRPGRQR